jgi:TRAP-type C4-dicarboxylate transport system permease small subunit
MSKNPLGKLELIISIFGGLMILFLLATIPSALMGDQSWFGFGDDPVCIEVPRSAVANSHGPGDGVSGAHVKNLVDGIRAHADQFQLCDSTPSTGQRALATMTELPRFVFFLGFLWITWRLTRRARRRGLFRPDVAAAIARLGVFLFIGEFVVVFSQGFATQRLLDTMVSTPDHGFYEYYAYAHFSWAVIFAAFGLQAMGRVMAMTVPMQAEIDATV